MTYRHLARALAASLLSGLITVTQPALAAADASPLLANGNFEAGAEGGSPSGWVASGKSLKLESEGQNHFLRLTSMMPGELVSARQVVTLPAGAEAFEFSYRVRHSDVRPGKFEWDEGRIILHFMNEGEEKRVRSQPDHPRFVGTSDGWQQRAQRFAVPKGVKYLEVILALHRVQAGTLDLDDLVLTPIAAATVPPTTLPSMASAVVAPPAADKLPSVLRVEGNQILNAAGKPVWLQGLALPSLEWAVEGENTVQAVEVAIDDWKANVIRLPVHEDKWFGREKSQTDGGAGYRQVIDSAINATAARGAYLVLDLHRYRAPKQEHADFWQAAATKYKNHPAVLFELMNEPHGISWEVWRDGGDVTDKKKPTTNPADAPLAENNERIVAFKSVGMQKLVDVIRETGAKNVIIAGGLDWGYDLSGILTGYALDDRGGNGIVYSSHVYPWKSGWQKRFLDVAAKHPVFIGECGAEVHRMGFIPPERHEDPYKWSPDMLAVIQKHQLHWTGWSFHPRATPRVIQDWYYTPTAFWGDHVKRALAGEQFELKKLR